MTPEDEAEIVRLLRESRDRSRGYADFFLWAVDRDLEEWGVVTALAESLEQERCLFFSDIISRRRPNDPPDCEARDHGGARLAIEVTELVDGNAIHNSKKAMEENLAPDWAEWPRDKFLSRL